MYCPNCGKKITAEQKFCRSCGLGLEKITEAVGEQLPTKLDESLEERKERLERWGFYALCVFGAGVLLPLLYYIVKLFYSRGESSPASGCWPSSSSSVAGCFR